MLPGEDKTKEQLTGELAALRLRIAELEQIAAEREKVEGAPGGTSRDLQLINLVNNAANQGDSLPRILQLVVHETKKIFSCNGATFYDISEDKKYLIMQNLNLPQTVAHQIERLIGAKIPPVRIRLREGSLYLQALRAGKPQLINDPETIQGLMAECTTNKLVKKLVPRIHQLLGIASVMQTPLISEGEVIGLVDISRKRPFTELELERFAAIAQQLLIVIKRKRAEAALRESEERYRTLVEDSPNLIGIFQDGVYKYVNKTMCEKLGWTFEELTSPSFDPIERLLDDDKPRETIRDNIRRRLRGEHIPPYEIGIRTKDSSWVPVMVYANAVTYGGKPADQVTYIDITERKQAEQVLREGETKYRTIFENVNDVVVRLNKRGKIIDANKRVEDYFGYKPDEIIGQNFIKLGALSPKDLPRVVKLFGERLKGKPLTFIELEVKRKDGSTAVLEASTTLIKKDGKIKGAIAIIRDITERKRAEEKRQTILKTALDGFWLASLEGKLLEVNDSYCKMVGYTREELLKMSISDLEAIESPEEVAQHIKKGVAQGYGRFETRHKRKDGQIIDVEISANYLDVGEGQLFLFARDITERKRAEEALQAEKNKLQSVIDAIEHGLSIQDTNYNILYQSEPSRMTGGYHLGEKCYRVYEGQDKVCHGCPVEKAFKDGKSYTAERRIVTLSGEIAFLENTASPIRDAEGNITSCLEVNRDVTERRQAEQVLRESEEKYRELAESITDIFFAFDKDLRYTYWNKASGELIGIPAKDALGKHLYDVFPDNEMTRRAAKVYLEALKTKKPQYFINDYNIGGKDYCFEISAYPSEDGLSVFARDITERKQAEEKRQTILKTALDGFWLASLEGKLLEVNDSYCKMTGYTREELLKMSIPDLEAVESPEDVAQRIKKIVAQGYDRFESRHKRKDGQIIDVEVSVNYLDVGGGQFFVFARDITERKRAEQVLRESEEKFRDLVTNVKLGVFRSTPEPAGKFLEVNPAMEEITGYSRKELLKMNVADLYVNPEERKVILEEVASGRGKPAREARLRKKDGTEIVISDTKVAVKDDGGQVIYFDGILEDITERKQAEEREEELQQELNLASRLAAVGELAAGVAHEMNNPLTGIMGFSERLLRKGADDDTRESLAIIQNEAQRLAKVVKNLLTFARQREPTKEYADINDIVQKTMELRAYELKSSNIEVALDLAVSLPQIMVDFHQIQEVFLNIILNAEQVMTEASGGGKLTIKTRQIKDYVRISFADDGPGIPAEHLDRVFNPFFTTKGERGGTGLGLSVCHGIVTEHGGRIYTRSKPGSGATFLVDLPLTSRKIGESQIAKAQLAV